MFHRKDLISKYNTLKYHCKILYGGFKTEIISNDRHINSKITPILVAEFKTLAKVQIAEMRVPKPCKVIA